MAFPGESWMFQPPELANTQPRRPMDIVKSRVAALESSYWTENSDRLQRRDKQAEEDADFMGRPPAFRCAAAGGAMAQRSNLAHMPRVADVRPPSISESQWEGMQPDTHSQAHDLKVENIAKTVREGERETYPQWTKQFRYDFTEHPEPPRDGAGKPSTYSGTFTYPLHGGAREGSLRPMLRPETASVHDSGITTRTVEDHSYTGPQESKYDMCYNVYKGYHVPQSTSVVPTQSKGTETASQTTSGVHTVREGADGSALLMALSHGHDFERAGALQSWKHARDGQQAWHRMKLMGSLHTIQQHTPLEMDGYQRRTPMSTDVSTAGEKLADSRYMFSQAGSNFTGARLAY